MLCFGQLIAPLLALTVRAGPLALQWAVTLEKQAKGASSSIHSRMKHGVTPSLRAARTAWPRLNH